MADWKKYFEAIQQKLVDDCAIEELPAIWYNFQIFFYALTKEEKQKLYEGAEELLFKQINQSGVNSLIEYLTEENSSLSVETRRELLNMGFEQAHAKIFAELTVQLFYDSQNL